MTDAKKDEPVRKYEVRCWGCGSINEINSKEHPYSVEMYESGGLMACQFCGMKFSKPKDPQ